MLTALLLYDYCQSVYSSRRIAAACEQRVDFMAVTALQKPDFRTISDFRKRHLKVLGALFEQVLSLCEQAGLVKLGHVALDGTKIRANASKHKAMSYGRMKQREAELAAADVPVALVESNGSWCVPDTLTREQLSRLQDAGVRGMYFSVDRYHQEFVPADRADRRISIAWELFGPGNLIPERRTGRMPRRWSGRRAARQHSCPWRSGSR